MKQTFEAGEGLMIYWWVFSVNTETGVNPISRGLWVIKGNHFPSSFTHHCTIITGHSPKSQTSFLILAVNLIQYGDINSIMLPPV